MGSTRQVVAACMPYMGACRSAKGRSFSNNTLAGEARQVPGCTPYVMYGSNEKVSEEKGGKVNATALQRLALIELVAILFVCSYYCWYNVLGVITPLSYPSHLVGTVLLFKRKFEQCSDERHDNAACFLLN